MFAGTKKEDGDADEGGGGMPLPAPAPMNAGAVESAPVGALVV